MLWIAGTTLGLAVEISAIVLLGRRVTRRFETERGAGQEFPAGGRQGRGTEPRDRARP